MFLPAQDQLSQSKKKKKRKKEKKELCKQFNSRGQSLLQSPQDGQMKALNSYQQQ